MKMVSRRSRRIPGSQFNPTNHELLKILGRKIKNGKRPSFVTDVDRDLYEIEPWLLHHVRHVKSKPNQFFYFVRKPSSSRKVVRSGSGRWKTTGALEEMKDVDGVKVGYVQNVSFLVKNGKKEKRTGWVMHEFLLIQPGFQKLGLCRLRFNPGKDNCNAQYAPRRQPRVIGQQPPKDKVDDLMDLRKEDLDNLLNLRDDLWNNLMNLDNVESTSEPDKYEVDDFTNLGLEDWDYIQSLENNWNSLIITLNHSQPPPKQTQEQPLPAQHQKILMTGSMMRQRHFVSSHVPIMMKQALVGGKA